MALLAAGLALGSAAASAIATGRQNKKSRQFQERMFHKTNKYNSPIEQRKRLEKAGLNPNLVYGGSSGGVAGTASQPAKPNFDTPNYAGIGDAAQTGLMNYYQTKNIQSGTDVNEARSKQIKQETVNAGIESVNKTIRNASDALDYKTKNRLFENTIKIAEERLNNLSQSSDYTQGKNQREEMIVDLTATKLQTEINNNRKRGKILSDEAIMKRLDAQLYQTYKLRPNDPFYMRIMGQILDKIRKSSYNPF